MTPYLAILQKLARSPGPLTLSVLTAELNLDGHSLTESAVKTELSIIDAAGDATVVTTKFGTTSASITPDGRHTLRNEGL